MIDKLYLQKTYAGLLIGRIENSSIKNYSPFLMNFKCPICGDSAKNRYRKRGYITEGNRNLIYTCHNECGTIGFERFLKDYYGDLYTMYRFDLFKSMKEGGFKAEEVQDDTEEETVELSRELDLDLASEHEIALQYIKSRQIPEHFYSDIYYTNKFHAYINEIIPNKFPEIVANTTEPRIILPMRGYDNKVFGMISRSLVKDAQSRYLTIKLDEDSPKFFGMNRINRDKFCYVAEGPIDSFFIENCIAMAGTDSNPDIIFSSKRSYAMILDNQPRSESVIKKYKMYIDRGCSIFIWPSKIPYKDINDCIVKGGMTADEINSIVKTNTYSDLKAKIMFNEWKRI